MAISVNFWALSSGFFLLPFLVVPLVVLLVSVPTDFSVGLWFVGSPGRFAFFFFLLSVSVLSFVCLCVSWFMLFPLGFLGFPFCSLDGFARSLVFAKVGVTLELVV